MKRSTTLRKSSTKPPPSRGAKCKECGAKYPTPLYNTAFNEQLVSKAKSEWVCADHLPRHLTNPVGLHGQDYAKWKANE